MESELIDIAQNLGYLEDGVYFTGEGCFECLQEIQNFLNYSENSLDRLLIFFKTNIAESDILPLLCSHSDDENLYYSIFQLIFTITSPIQSKIFDEEISKSSYHIYIQLIDYQNSFRDKFSDSCAIHVLKDYLVRFIKTKNENLSLDSSEYLDLILSIFINIFNETSLTRDMAFTMQKLQCIYDKLLKQLKDSGCLDIFIYMTNNSSQCVWSYQVLEILYKILHHLDPHSLAIAQSSDSIKNHSSQKLQLILNQEKFQRINKIKQLSSRHPAFGGTVIKSDANAGSSFNYVVTNADSYNKEGCLQSGKKMMKKTSKQLKTINIMSFRTIPISISQYMNEFCIKFMSLSFNAFHHNIKGFKIDSHNSNTVDHYLWYIWFFLNFNRHSSQNIELIGCVLTSEIFAAIYHLSIEFLDKIKKDQKSRHHCVTNLNYCILFYQEFFEYLNLMENSKDSRLQHSESILLANIFYVTEYKDVFLLIFKAYPKEFYILDFIKSLITSFSVFFRILNTYYNKKGSFIVKRKRRNKDKSHIKTKINPNWKEIENNLRQQFNHCMDLNTPTLNFDPQSNDSIQEQLYLAKKSIKQLMCKKKFKDALLLYRSVSNFIGRNSYEIEQDILDLQKIYELDFNDIDEAENSGKELPESQDDKQQSSSSDHSDSLSCYVEDKFNFDDYIRKYSCTSVVRMYCHLLQYYKDNHTYINDCIVKYMKYICIDVNMPYVFYHISFFRIFNELLNSEDNLYPDLKNIAAIIVKEFFKTLQTFGNEIICYILFWKPLAQQTNIFLDTSKSCAENLSSPLHPNLTTSSNNIKDSLNLEVYSEKFNAHMYDDHHHIDKENINNFIVISDEDVNSKSNQSGVEHLSPISRINLPEIANSKKMPSENNVHSHIIENSFEPTFIINGKTSIDTFKERLIEQTVSIINKGYQRVVEWIINCLESEKETRFMLFLKDTEPLELIPNGEDTAILTQQIFTDYFNLMGFKPPTDEFEDPFWKLLPNNHAELIAILNKTIGKSA